MNSLLLAQVKAAKLPPAYVYVASLGRYRDAVTGRFVALKTVFGLLNSNEAASLDKMQKLSRALADGKLPVNAWYLAVQQHLRRLNVQNAALAAGGFDALKPRDLKRIDAALRDDLERLNRFGADIVAGRLSKAQIDSRTAMYAGHARTQYYATLPKPVTKSNQVVLERRRLGEGEHCKYCTYLVNLGWQPYGTLPLPGESDPDWQDEQCFTNCHCDLERQVFSKVEAATLVKPLKAFFVFEYSHTNKGGEGSGNFGHAGRPGERGGSAPQNGKLLSNYQADPYGVPKGNDLAFDEAIQRYDYNGHPLLTLYLGKQDTGMSSSDWLASLPSQRKSEVVDALAKGTGLPGYECSDFIKQWADTSNDHNVASLTIQEEAAKLFGGELTDWQRIRLEGAQSTRNWIIDSEFGHVEDEHAAILSVGEDIFANLRNRKPNSLLPFERSGFRKMLDDLADEVDNGTVDLTSGELKRRIAVVEQEAKEKTRQALRFVYDHTQETLKQAGIKELHVYRGAVLSDSVAASFKVGETAHVQSNPLSSWSLAQETAAEFAEGVGGGSLSTKGTRSVVFDAIIPASRIYSIPVTGQGCLLEWEAVVIGSPQDTVRVYAVDDEMVKAFIKGGEGSGNFGHAGRPGERGGSAPADTLEDDPFAPPKHTAIVFEDKDYNDKELDGVEVLADFGLSEDALAKMVDLGLPGSKCSIQLKRDGDKLEIKGSWREDWSYVGTFTRILYKTDRAAYLDMLSFTHPYIGKHYGINVARQWYRGLAQAGYKTAELFADLTVGKYAWAKEGAQYVYDWELERANKDFGKWLKAHNVPGLEDNLPTFKNPQDVANYQHPDGYTLKGSDITNKDVSPDLVMPLGKAYMLDDKGHGSWHAVLDLTQWRDKDASVKAARMAKGKNDNTLHYIEVGQDIPGATDGEFWAQYLTEEEGAPIFGFGEQFGKSLPIKGGEGSGNHGHAGIPGHQGGSAPTGHHTDTAGTQRTGLRADWAQEKHYLLYAYASDTPWESFMRDEAARITEFRKKTDERIKLIEALSQDERADLYVSLTRAKSGYSLFQTKYDDTFQAALATGDKQKIAEVLSQMEPEQWVKDDHVFKLLGSRLDEDHAMQVMKELAEQERQYRAKYPTDDSKVPYNESDRHGTLAWGTYALMEVGPTDKFRREAVALYQAVGGRMGSVAIASGDVDQDMARLVDFWTTDSRTPGNPWVHAAAAKAFGGAEQVVGYWNYMSYGVVYNDPDPGYVAAAKAIYQKTQAFYAKKKNKDFTVLRGVNSPVSVRSPLESWTLSQKTAQHFDGYAVLERTEPLERVFMTWEAMKGIFPPEKDLHGKKEVVLIGPDWMKP